MVDAITFLELEKYIIKKGYIALDGMSITVVPSVVTVQTFSASNYNTQVRDNINGLWVATTAGDIIYATGASAAARLGKPSVDAVLKNTSAGTPSWKAISEFMPGTTAGDVDYYTSSGVKARLAIGALGTFFRSTGSAPEWGSLVYRRQGSSATDWRAYGTTNYTPAKSIVQAGNVAVSMSSGNGSASITFPVAFTNKPLIFISCESNPQKYSYGYRDLVTTGFGVAALQLDGAETLTIQFSWLAIGE